MTTHAALASLIIFVRAELVLLFCALAALVAYQLLTGTINLKGVFLDAKGDFSPSRIQLLVATLAVAGGYLVEPKQISSASAGVSALMGGSSLTYLVQKFRAMSA